MVDILKLRGKMAEKGYNSITSIANATGIKRSCLYRKLTSEKENFLIKEVDALAKVLELNASEINTIFFSQIVA